MIIVDIVDVNISVIIVTAAICSILMPGHAIDAFLLPLARFAP